MTIGFQFKLIFAFIIIANILIWFYARPIKTEWRNVPPAPTKFGAHAIGLGDYDLSYRSIGFMLQNIGKSDGRTQNLATYDYEELERWFFRSYDLVPQSSYVPILAAFYYGGVSDPEKVRHVVNFLKIAGNDPAFDKWRWIVHAIFLARHKMEDLDLAYELAEILKNIDNPDKPAWTEMMPAMIKNSKGEKEDAYLMLRAMLESSSDTLHPAEVNHLIGYICEQVLNMEDAAKDPICELNKS